MVRLQNLLSAYLGTEPDVLAWLVTLLFTVQDSAESTEATGAADFNYMIWFWL